MEYDVESDVKSKVKELKQFTNQSKFSEKMIWHNHIDAQGYIALAEQFLKNGHILAAIQKYEQALVLEPDNAAVFARLGDIFLSLGQVEEADRYYYQAVEVETKNGEYIARLARTTELMGEHQVAQLLFQMAQELG